MKKVRKAVQTPKCPACGKQAVSTETRFGVRHEHCGLWSWGNKPLTDAYTHTIRKHLHQRVLEESQNRFVSSYKIYHVLAVEIGLSSWKSFSNATEEECQRALKTMKKLDQLLVPVEI